MPSVSKQQQRFMAIDLARARFGVRTKTGMSVDQLREFAHTPRKGLPYRAASGRKARRRRIAEIRGG